MSTTATDAPMPKVETTAKPRRARAKKAAASQPSVRRGPKKPQPPYYVALKHMDLTRKNGRRVHYKPGDIVPEAKDWLRVESWVRSRHLELVEA